MSTLLRLESCYLWRTLLSKVAPGTVLRVPTLPAPLACLALAVEAAIQKLITATCTVRCQINLRPSKRGSLHKMIFYSRTPLPHFTVTCVLAFLRLPRSSGLMLRVKSNGGATHIGRAVHWFPFFVAVSCVISFFLLGSSVGDKKTDIHGGIQYLSCHLP